VAGPECIEDLGMLEIGDPGDNREGHKCRMTLAHLPSPG
jgi:hypothetical protein